MNKLRTGIPLGALVMMFSIGFPAGSWANPSGAVEQNEICGGARVTSDFITISGVTGMVWDGEGRMHDGDYAWLRITPSHSPFSHSHTISFDIHTDYKRDDGYKGWRLHHRVIDENNSVDDDRRDIKVISAAPAPLNSMGYHHVTVTLIRKKGLLSLLWADVVPEFGDSSIHVANVAIDGQPCSISASGVEARCR
jgi:hypothetical protein